MAHALTLEIPDEVYEPLLARAEQIGKTPQGVAAEYLAAAVEQWINDPLLKLVGTIESDLTDVAERHDYYIGQQLTLLC